MENLVQAPRLERRSKSRTLETMGFDPHDGIKIVCPIPSIIQPGRQPLISFYVCQAPPTYPFTTHLSPRAGDRREMAA